MPRKRNDLTNQTFGQLLALKDTGRVNHNRTRIWECKCLACGSLTEKPSTKLTNQEVRSCGCLEHMRSTRSAPGHSGANSGYSTYRCSARKRKLEFALSFEDYKDIVGMPCHYCGVSDSKIVFGSKGNALSHGQFSCNGIDRKNNELGYVKGNCVPCCTQCNLAKGPITEEQFVEWIHRTSRHLTNLNKKS